MSKWSTSNASLLHEIGHALGLRHPRNTDAGDAWDVQLPEADDRPALTAMSGTASADGLYRACQIDLNVLSPELTGLAATGLEYTPVIG